MRVLMTGGGTGGHINPAVAIANTIKKNHPDAEIAFVGTKRGKEKELVPKDGYPLYFVDVQGIERSLTLRNIKALYLAWVSPMRAKKIASQISARSGCRNRRLRLLACYEGGHEAGYSHCGS